MAKINFLFKFFLLTKIIFISSQNLLDDQQLKVIDSINENLNIKNFIIVKDSLNQIDFKLISFTKHLSKEKIFSTVVDVEILKIFMESRMYFPRTIAFPQEPNENIFKSIFTHVNNFAHYRFRPIWLAFDDSYEKFQGLFIPYNCKFLIARESGKNKIIVKEIFHHKNEEKLHEVYFGAWRENEGFEVSTFDFYKERFNMNGTILYFLPMTPDGLCNGVECALVTIAKTFSKMMNFRLEFLYSENLFYLLGDKSINSIPIEGALIEASLSSVYPDNDWIGPFWVHSSYIYIAYDKTYEYKGISPYFRPFSFNLWMVILGWLFLAGIISSALKFFIIKFKIQFFKQHSYFDAFFQLFETITNQECDEIPQEISSRLATFSGRFVGLFMMPAYCGALLSFIVLPQFTLPFTDMYGLIRTGGEYKLRFLFDARSADIQDVNLLTNVKSVNVDINDLPRTYDEGIYKMCNDHKVALVLGDMEEWEVKECRILKIPKPFFTSWYVIFMPIHSPYKSIFNRAIKTLFSAGVLKFHGTPFQESIIKETLTTKVDPVDIENLVMVFVMIGIIYAIAISVLISEKIFFKINLKWSRQKKTFIKVNNFLKVEEGFLDEKNFQRLKLANSARVVAIKNTQRRRAATAY